MRGSVSVLRGVVHGAFEKILAGERRGKRDARVAGAEDDVGGVEGTGWGGAVLESYGPG